MNSKSNFISGVLLLCILLISSIMQMQLKKSPLVFLIVFTGLTILSFLLKYEKVSTVLFFTLVGLLLLFSFFIITLWGIELFLPASNVREIDDEKVYVMDMHWLLGIPVTLILTPLTLFYYHRLSKRNRKTEILFLILFMITTVLIFFK